MGDNKDFLIVTEKGIIGSGVSDANMVLSMLLHAYLNVWNKEIGEIDILESAKKIIDMLGKPEPEPEKEPDLYDLIDMILKGEDK